MSEPKPEAAKTDDAAKKPPEAPPSLLRVVLLCIAWTVVITLHYWACGLSAYLLGDPTDLPFWLKPWNELMNYGISGFLSLLLAVVWWLAAALLFLPAITVVFAVDFVFDYVDPPDPVHPVGSALGESLLAVLPTMLLTWLSLLILPFDSPNRLDGEAGLAVAERLSYPAFAEYMFLSLFAMLTIAVLAIGFCIGVGLMMRFSPFGGAWEILPPVFLGIAFALVFAFVVGPTIGEMPHDYGVLPATAIFIGGFSLLSTPPTLWIVRSL
jgi:hypothetical protein